MTAAPAPWYPLRLSGPARPLVFGGHAIARHLGRTGLPDWSIAETWEVSDVDGDGGTVTNGPLNVGAPVTVVCGGAVEELGRAQTLLLPAALGRLEIAGPADVLLGYLPDLERDVRAPLTAAGHGPEPIAALGEGLGA
ncbi:hypothetical protein [Actinocorallia populi]|uniref:hypothetical protein n=1 Tax=Actinocorallia populi TaxID=2079200 RepID=UPI000D08908E|nr:hypothetical protein [Actinocorallia populi]